MNEPHPLEEPQAGEAEAVGRVVERLRTMMSAQLAASRAKGSPAPMRRDVHQKMHALVRAELTVEPQLPEPLRVGLFAREATYPAWVRFSNAANGIAHDAVPDVRGMAVKVMGVEGPQLLGGDAATQDLVFMSGDHFPVRSVAEFDGLAAAIIGSLWRKLGYFATHPATLWRLMRISSVPANPLQVRYFSAVPYLYGKQAVKFCATPHFFTRTRRPPDAGPDFLRDAAREQLASEPAWFDIGVQLRRDGWSIEDGRARWPERESPFIKVATLRIPAQDFDTAERRAWGEQLSFNPWHGLVEHQPLGNLNRGRRAVYQTLSAYRHRVNRAEEQEPRDWGNR